MRKRMAAAILAFFCLISLSGCNLITTNLDMLIKPPTLDQDQKLIYNALQASLKEKSGIRLCYPKNGDFRSAIIPCILDPTHPGKQALAFYQSSLQSNVSDSFLRVCLLDQIGGEWQVIWDLPGKGSDVNQVLFYTDKATGQPFVVIGYASESQAQNDFCIYRYQNDVFEQVYSNVYQMLEIYDLDNDGQDELIVISYPEDAKNKDTVQNTAPLHTTAQMIRYQGGAFVTVDQTPTMGKATAYINSIKNTATFGKPALFLDEQITKTTYATEILTYENHHLTNLIYQGKGNLFNQTMRTQVPVSYDINRDGLIEIPQTDYFPGYSSSSLEPMYQTTWYKLSGQEFTPAAYSYINYSQGYGFLMPESWKNRVSVEHILENDEILFFEYTGNIADTRLPVLSIKTQSLNTIHENGLPEGYFQIDAIGQVVYLAKAYQGEDPTFRLSKEDIIKRFVAMRLSNS